VLGEARHQDLSGLRVKPTATDLPVIAGQRGDRPQFAPVLEGIRLLGSGPGRPRIRPVRVRGDTPCSSRADRAYLQERDALSRMLQAARRPGGQPQAAGEGRRPSFGLRPRGQCVTGLNCPSHVPC
jgi:hypothetical protein